MTNVRPELLFLTGPQQGQTIVIADNVALAGRLPSCQIRITETYASRRHVRFERTAEGWVVENLSPNGTFINGKKYKSGKKVLLETGDVLGVGRETEILFVSPGDDPTEALAGYHRQRKASGEVSAGEPSAAAEQAPEEAEAAERPAEAPAGPKPPSAKAKRLARAPRGQSKLRKYAIFGAVYVVALVVLLVALGRLKNSGNGGPSRIPRLTDERIARALLASLDRPRDPTKAAQALDDALELYNTRRFKTGNLYRCVKNFKLYLAYKDGDFDEPTHERMYQQAGEELVELVRRTYRNAYAHERDDNYRRARELYRELLDIIPERDPDDPVYRVLFRNFKDRLSYVSERVRQR